MSEASTSSGLQRIYENLGYRGYSVVFPEDAHRRSTREIHRLAEGIVGVRDRVYNRNPALTSERIEETADAIISGSPFFFTLLDPEGNVSVTTQLIPQVNIYPDSQVRIYELGGTAKAPSTRSHIARPLLEGQIRWAQENLRDAPSYLIANARVACKQEGRPYNGNISEFLLAETGAYPTYPGYDHYVGPQTAEPFLNMAAPLQVTEWNRTIVQQPIYLPKGDSKEAIDGFFSENPDNKLILQTRNVNAAGRSREAIPVYVAEPPQQKNEAIYFMTTRQADLPSYTMGNSKRAPGLSDRVIVEADITSNPDYAAAAYTQLQTHNFVFCGWIPSSQDYGKLAAIFGRSGVIPKTDSVSEPDVSALTTRPITHRFITEVFSRLRPRQE